MQQHTSALATPDNEQLKKTSASLVQSINAECSEIIDIQKLRLPACLNFPELLLTSPEDYVSKLKELTKFHDLLIQKLGSNLVYFSKKEVPETFSYWTGSEFQEINSNEYASSILKLALNKIIKDITLAKTKAEETLKTEINQHYSSNLAELKNRIAYSTDFVEQKDSSFAVANTIGQYQSALEINQLLNGQLIKLLNDIKACSVNLGSYDFFTDESRQLIQKLINELDQSQATLQKKIPEFKTLLIELLDRERAEESASASYVQQAAAELAEEAANVPSPASAMLEIDLKRWEYELASNEEKIVFPDLSQEKTIEKLTNTKLNLSKHQFKDCWGDFIAHINTPLLQFLNDSQDDYFIKSFQAYSDIRNTRFQTNPGQSDYDNHKTKILNMISKKLALIEKIKKEREEFTNVKAGIIHNIDLKINGSIALLDEMQVSITALQNNVNIPETMRCLGLYQNLRDALQGTDTLIARERGKMHIDLEAQIAGNNSLRDRVTTQGLRLLSKLTAQVHTLNTLLVIPDNDDKTQKFIEIHDLLATFPMGQNLPQDLDQQAREEYCGALAAAKENQANRRYEHDAACRVDFVSVLTGKLTSYQSNRIQIYGKKVTTDSRKIFIDNLLAQLLEYTGNQAKLQEVIKLINSNITNFPGTLFPPLLNKILITLMDQDLIIHRVKEIESLESLKIKQEKAEYETPLREPKKLFDAISILRTYAEKSNEDKEALLQLANAIEGDTRSLMENLKGKDSASANGIIANYKITVTARLHTNPNLKSKHNNALEIFINALFGFFTLGIGFLIKNSCTRSPFFQPSPNMDFAKPMLEAVSTLACPPKTLVLKSSQYSQGVVLC